MKITSITKIPRNDEEIYNLEVADNHNYFVEDILVSNCHMLKQKNNVTSFVKKLDTHIRYGFTGTLPEERVDKWAVKGIVGPLLYSEKSHTFQESGILAPIKIFAFKFKHQALQPWADDPQKLFHKEWKLIESSPESNLNIAKIATKFQKNTLLLFDHTSHGKELFNVINNINMNEDFPHECFFINGQTELDHREDVRQKMEEQDNIILVANVKCFGVGINIKNIYNIVFAMSGKGKTKIIQGIGRGLRQLENKTLNLIDIYHDYRYSTKHFLKRCSLYEEHYDKGVDKSFVVKL